MRDHVTVYDPEEFEREFGAEDSPPLPTLGAAAALIRSAGEFPDVELLPPERPYRDNLKQDGSQFILISCALLEKFAAQVKEDEPPLPIPSDGRDFALWMEGMADGNFTEPFRCTDEQIAAVYGYTEKSVREKRAALLRWQTAANTTIVEVIEGMFNPEKGRNDPTEYVVRFGEHVTKFIRRVREIPEFRRNPVRYIEHGEDAKLTRLLNEVKDDLNPNLSVRRKPKKEAQPPKEDRVVQNTKIKLRLKRLLEKWSDNEYEMTSDTSEAWAELRAELDATVGGAPARWDAKQRKTKPARGRGRPRK